MISVRPRVPQWAAPTGVPDPDVLIAAQLIEQLRRCGARLVPDLARSAVHLVRREGWKERSFANVHDFAREQFDHSGRWVRNLARLGQAFQEMPALTDAVTAADGQRALGRAAALEISRVADPDTVTLWIECARHCTLRELKRHIRRVVAARSQASPLSGRSSVDRSGDSSRESSEASSSDPSAHSGSRRKQSFKCTAPRFLPESVEDLRRVFEAIDPGQPRHAFLQALVAEHASGDGAGMVDVDAGIPSEPVSPSQVGLQLQHEAPGTAQLASDFTAMAGPLLPPQFLPPRGFRPAAGPASLPHLEGSAESAENFVSSVDQRQDPTGDASRKVLLRARWTIQAVQSFLERIGDRPSAASRAGATVQARIESPVRASEIARDMREALRLEHEITLRVDALLLWIDHRRAWSFLGCADAAEFGERVLDESASTIRKRLALARAQDDSPALHRAAESGRVSRERLVRLAELVQRGKLDEGLVQQWSQHVSAITIKQVDDELRCIARRRYRNPRPMGDAEWRESLRLTPGAARQRILLEGLQLLGSRAVADEFLQLDGPADVMRDLRHSLNGTRLQLAACSHRLQDATPADAARTFPSIRLAQRCVSRRKPIPDWMCVLSLLEEFAEQWDNPRAIPRRPTDAVLERDGYRCTAPGCTSRELEVHHIVYKSRGGSDDPSNLTSLCPFHHRMAVHGGRAILTGEAPLALHWRIGRGDDVVEYIGERRVGTDMSTERNAPP